MKKKKRIIIIGGGLSGLAAALHLAVKGHDVMILEKNKYVGGQLLRTIEKGYAFHYGADFLTMPDVLLDLFQTAKKKLSDYLTLVPLHPPCRFFFPDGTSFDLTKNLPEVLTKRKSIFKIEVDHFFDLCQYSHTLMQKKLHHQSTLSLLFHQLKNQYYRYYRKPLAELNNQFFQDPQIQQFFNFFAMFESLSPAQASPHLLYMVHEILHSGLYAIKEGTYRLIEALVQILYELGVQIRTEAEVCKILTECFEVVGIELTDGTQLPADIILCSIDPKSTYQHLLKGFSQAAKVAKKFHKNEPLLSGHYLLLGVKKTYQKLSYHNFFFSKNPEQELHFLFEKKEPAPDPTVYVGVSSLVNPQHAPEGKQNLIIFSHVPPLREGENWEQYRKPFYSSYRIKVITKLEKMGLHQLERNIEWEKEITPDELKEYLKSVGGTIYGMGSPKKRMPPFHAYKAEKINSLYFIGNSVASGHHISSILLSSKMITEQIEKEIQTYV